MKNLDVGALQAVFEVLQQHYPERLGELWFLNAPFIFWGLWRVVSPFIHQATKEKIKFLSGKERERMLQYIPQDVSFVVCLMHEAWVKYVCLLCCCSQACKTIAKAIGQFGRAVLYVMSVHYSVGFRLVCVRGAL